MGWKLIRRALLAECIQQFRSMLRLKLSLSCAQIDETFLFSEAVLPLNDVCEPVIYNTPQGHRGNSATSRTFYRNKL